MHFVYFAESKLTRFYDYLVERTEETTTSTVMREGEGKAGAKGKGKIGSILAWLGLVSVEVEADVSVSGKVSFSKDMVAAFEPAQKLKALLLKLESEGGLADLNSARSLPKYGSLVAFAAWLKADTDKRSEAEIERCGQVILAGKVNEKRSILIQATLSFLESPNAWRRLGHERYIAGIGTLLGPDSSGDFLEIDPIALNYATESDQAAKKRRRAEFAKARLA